MVFHWSLSDSKSPQVPRTRLRIITIIIFIIIIIIIIIIINHPFTCKNICDMFNFY